MARQQKVEPPKTRNTVLTGIVIVVALLLLSVILSFFVGVVVLMGPSQGFDGNVAIVEVKGQIYGDDPGSFSQGASASAITNLLSRAADDPSVQAVVIEINSPGGSPVGSAEIAGAIKAIDKPTVAWIREVGASGGYWAASAADHVIAHELSVTGSIGVYGSYLDFSGFLQDHNITYQRLVAGEHKDTGSPLRPLSSSEELLLQSKLDKMREVFVRAVAQNRNLSYDKVEGMADGMYLLGDEALEAGLVDELGGKAEVTAYLESLNITPRYAYLRQDSSLWGSLAGVIAEHGFSMGEGLAYGLRENDMLVRT